MEDMNDASTAGSQESAGARHDQNDSQGQAATYDAVHSFNTIGRIYDEFAPYYEDPLNKSRLRTFQHDMHSRFPHHGFTLDLGCGTGVTGFLIRQSPLNHAASDDHAKPYIHGVDLSDKMLQHEWCKDYYDSFQLSSVQGVLRDPTTIQVKHAADQRMKAGASLPAPQIDHITCFGMLHFVRPQEFETILSRMFALAQHSISFDIDDLTPSYIDRAVEKAGEGFRNYNHVNAYRQFDIPQGWAKVVEEETVLYDSRHLGVDVSGILVRFERVD